MSIDMDFSEAGLSFEEFLEGRKPPASATRFKSVVKRCKRAMGDLKSSGTLKEERSLILIALRESYLMCEYISGTKSLEIQSCGEWLAKRGDDIVYWEIGPGRQFIFSKLWKQGIMR